MVGWRALLLAGSLTGVAAIPAAPPRPEVLISTLRVVGHKLPRDLLVQLYANAIKLSDFSSAANGTVLSGPDERRELGAPSAAASRSALSLSAATTPLYADGAYADGANRVWLCKRPVYPVSLLTQYGIPLDVAEEVNARGYHAYVLHGTAPHTSLAYQFTSTNGWELWNKVLSILKDKGAGGMEQLSKEDVAEWGKTIAAEIAGPAETSASPGLKIFTTASQCWGSELPSRCSPDQMSEATKTYAARRPEFNLLSNNCARFACAMLAACGGATSEAGEAGEAGGASRLHLLANASEPALPAMKDAASLATCQPDSCADHLMFEGPRGEPGCGMHAVSTSLMGSTALAAPAPAAQPAPAAEQPQPQSPPLDGETAALKDKIIRGSQQQEGDAAAALQLTPQAAAMAKWAQVPMGGMQMLPVFM